VNTETDVVVVGAGPAGSFAALTAAKMGAEVTICEEHKEVGIPSHCPGHISIKGLDKLGMHVPEKFIENRISGAVFYSPSGNEFRVKLQSPVTYVINRTMLDKHLAQLAERAGARLMLGTRVEKLLLNDASVTGVLLKSGEHWKSGTVVDAEGVASTLLRQVGMQTFDRSRAVSAVNGEIDQADCLEDDTVEVYLGQKFALGLYAWMIPKRDGSAKIGLATRTGNAKEHLKLFLRNHPTTSRKIRFSDVHNLSYHLIPLGGPIRKTYHNGFLAVGDVASQVKPTTGGGVVMGLTCARIAGETAAQAVQQRDFSGTFLSSYQKRWKQAIGFDMNAMRQIRLMLNRLSDRKLDGIIRLCSQLHVDERLQGLEDIDFQGKATLQLLKSPGAWTIMMYSLLSSLVS
jgi:digeranylgeranylglycerophospholipid reductase